MSDSGSHAPDSEADMTQSHSARIGLLTDIHWAPEHADDLHQQLTDAFKHFDRTNVDHVVVLGDLIQDGDTAAESRDRLQNALTLFDQETTPFDAPVTHLLGNHDVMHTSSKDFREIVGADPTCGTFPLTDSITGVYLDTSAPEYPDARGKLGPEQRAYLEHVLETSADNGEYVVVFTHHPVYYHDLSQDGHFPEHPEAAFASDKYLVSEIFEKYGNVIAAVNGHTHISDFTEYNGTPHFTINAFNYERPGFTDPNGSFAVLEVSRSRVKRISYQHGEFTGTDTVQHPAGDQLVALGGTFGPLHDGHRNMFQHAFEVGDVMIGLTSDELSSQTRHTDRSVPSFDERRETLHDELEELSELYDREFEIRELTDPMGYVTEDPSFTHLIVSPETFSRGEQINEVRLANGLEPLTLEVVDPVLAEDGQRISSTRIVNGEIDEHGNRRD